MRTPEETAALQNQTAAIEALSATMAGNLTLHNAIGTVPVFDGENLPLKDFIQTIKNSAEGVAPGLQSNLVLFILNKLQGKAKNSTYGKSFASIDALITHLKTRFAQGKTFDYYADKINKLYMKEDETVADFKDRLTVLLGCAESALKEEKGPNYNNTMIETTKDKAIDVFIKGLPSEMSRDVDKTQPATLDEAYREAVRLEMRMDAKIIPDLRPRRPRGPRETSDYRYDDRERQSRYHDDRDRYRNERENRNQERYDSYDRTPRRRYEESPHRIRFIEPARSPSNRRDYNDRGRADWRSPRRRYYYADNNKPRRDGAYNYNYRRDNSSDRNYREETRTSRYEDYRGQDRPREYSQDRNYNRQQSYQQDPNSLRQREYSGERRYQNQDPRTYTPDQRYQSRDCTPEYRYRTNDEARSQNRIPYRNSTENNGPRETLNSTRARHDPVAASPAPANTQQQVSNPKQVLTISQVKRMQKELLFAKMQ